jgi:hypothetical protein
MQCFSGYHQMNQTSEVKTLQSYLPNDIASRIWTVPTRQEHSKRSESGRFDTRQSTRIVQINSLVF